MTTTNCKTMQYVNVSFQPLFQPTKIVAYIFIAGL